MNDHDAMTAINAVLDKYFRGELTQLGALARIAQISGHNANEHAPAKEARP